MRDARLPIHWRKKSYTSAAFGSVGQGDISQKEIRHSQMRHSDESRSVGMWSSSSQSLDTCPDLSQLGPGATNLRKPHPLSSAPYPRGCIQLSHSRAHRCSGNQRIVQTKVGGHGGTVGPRIPPCPGSLTSGSETEDKDHSGTQYSQQNPGF